MDNPDEIKRMVRDKYGKIALNVLEEKPPTSCCGSIFDAAYTIMNDDYSNLDGYNPDADLGLGCGIPTNYAGIKPGDTVLDLGSGAGNDVFIARRQTGEEGYVIGIDMTEEMIRKARLNNDKMGYSNVEFRLGEIEELPVDSDSVDVLLSNCVLNLVPDKAKAFSEIHRVLKTGAHFTVSDIVLNGDLPGKIRQAAEMYAGCVAGALQQEDYIDIVRAAGFDELSILSQKPIVIPDEILGRYLVGDEINDFDNSGAKIMSITLYGIKN